MYIKFVLFMLGFAMIAFGIGFCAGMIADCEEQEPRWIPVSERLPNTDDVVLCWYEYYHWTQQEVLPEYGLGRYLRDISAWYGEVARGKDVRVIAWKPLPKPYKSPESEE